MDSLLGIFLYWVGVIKAQVGQPAVILRDSKFKQIDLACPICK